MIVGVLCTEEMAKKAETESFINGIEFFFFLPDFQTAQHNDKHSNQLSTPGWILVNFRQKGRAVLRKKANGNK